jgi:hypothetical protein
MKRPSTSRWTLIRKRWLLYALKRCGFNKTHAAEWLGVSLRTIRNWELEFKLREKLPNTRRPNFLTLAWHDAQEERLKNRREYTEKLRKDREKARQEETARMSEGIKKHTSENSS